MGIEQIHLSQTIGNLRRMSRPGVIPTVSCHSNCTADFIYAKSKCLSLIGENLTLLETLDLYFCPSSNTFQSKACPKSLLELIIHDCPLIEKRCRKYKGKYWPVITLIAYVKIDYRLVFGEDSS